MWRVGVIAKQELKRVLTYRKIEGGFGLAAAEVAMVVIDRNRQIEGRQLGIDENMMMSGFLLLQRRWRNAHSIETEQDPYGIGHDRAIHR